MFVYEDKLPKNIHTIPYHSNLILGSFVFHHISQVAAKAWIIKALELGYDHLQHNKLKVSVELTHTILRKPRIHKVIFQLEDFFENFRVVYDFKDIKGVAPNLDVLASIGKKLTQLVEEAGDYLVRVSTSLGHPQVKWPTDLSFWMAQVFTDLGSTSVEAGTCHKYPPYLSLNLVLKFLIRVRDI